MGNRDQRPVREFVNAEINPDFDTEGNLINVTARDWKVFTCNSGGTFTLEFWVEFDVDLSTQEDRSPWSFQVGPSAAAASPD